MPASALLHLHSLPMSSAIANRCWSHQKLSRSNHLQKFPSELGVWPISKKKKRYLSETRIPLMEFYQRWRRMALQNGKCDDGYQQLLVPSHFVDNCRFMTCLIQGWNDTGSCLLAHSVSATRTDRKWLAASTTISFPSLAYISSKRKLRWGSFYFPSD